MRAVLRNGGMRLDGDRRLLRRRLRDGGGARRAAHPATGAARRRRDRQRSRAARPAGDAARSCCFRALGRVEDAGVNTLLVEQNARRRAAIAGRGQNARRSLASTGRGHLHEDARTAGEGRARRLLEDRAVSSAYLGMIGVEAAGRRRCSRRATRLVACSSSQRARGGLLGAGRTSRYRADCTVSSGLRGVARAARRGAGRSAWRGLRGVAGTARPTGRAALRSSPESTRPAGTGVTPTRVRIRSDRIGQHVPERTAARRCRLQTESRSRGFLRSQRASPRRVTHAPVSPLENSRFTGHPARPRRFTRQNARWSGHLARADSDTR